MISEQLKNKLQDIDKLDFVFKMLMYKLEDYEVEAVFPEFSNSKFKTGDLVIRKNGYSDSIYIVDQITLSGRVKLIYVMSSCGCITEDAFERGVISKIIDLSYEQYDDDPTMDHPLVDPNTLEFINKIYFISGNDSFNNGKIKKSLSYYVSLKPNVNLKNQTIKEAKLNVQIIK